jgi:hypothetical protein
MAGLYHRIANYLLIYPNSEGPNESKTNARRLMWYGLPTPALRKEGQEYYCNNILINLQMIFIIDNKNW